MFRSAAAMRSRIGGKLATSVTIDDSINRPARRLAPDCISRSRRSKSIDWLVVALPSGIRPLRHEIEICIVDGGRDRFQEIFMVSSDGERQSSPLRGDFDAFGDGLIERRQPLAHGRCARLRSRRSRWRRDRATLDPRVQHLDLPGDAAGDCISVLSSSAAINCGAAATRVLASSASRSDSTVAGMLRDTISASVVPILADA